jgi:hypothetical protein
LLTGNQPWKDSPVSKDANLGTALEAIVREACKPHDRADPWTFAHWFGGFTLWRNEKRAEIKILLSNDRAEIFEFGVSTPPMLPGLSKGTLIEPRRGRLDMPVTASADTFNFMADLVLDSEHIRGLEKGNAGTVGTDPASVLSQPGASPANIFQCMLKDSDLEEREQGAASSDSHGSPSSSGPLDHQSKDEPSWRTITSA